MAGDNIQYGPNKGVVLFIVGMDDYPSGWSGSKDWFEKTFGRGFMLDLKAVGNMFLPEPDEDLKFISRQNNVS